MEITKSSSSMASILHFILVFMTLHGTLASPKTFLDEHYKKTKTKSDTISYPNHRRTQLYSRNSGRHVQILSGGKVVAKGNSGDKFAGLVIFTNSYGRVRIKGLVTDRYLCFDKRGHLISKKRATTKCIFQETFGKDAFTQYQSTEGKFLAFSKKGSVRLNGHSGNKAVQFVERPKPRKVKDRYYRGKTKRIFPWMLKQDKMLAKKNRSKPSSKNGRVRFENRRKKEKRVGKKNKKSRKTVEKKLKRRGKTRKKSRFSSGGIGRRNHGGGRRRKNRGGRKRKGITRKKGNLRYGFLRLYYD